MPFLGCSQCWPIPSLHSGIGCPLRKQTSTERAKGATSACSLNGWSVTAESLTAENSLELTKYVSPSLRQSPLSCFAAGS